MEILGGLAAVATILGLIYAVWSRQKAQPVQDLSMSLADFDQRIEPELLRDGWEVKKPRPDGVWALQQEGWKENISTEYPGSASASGDRRSAIGEG